MANKPASDLTRTGFCRFVMIASILSVLAVGVTPSGAEDSLKTGESEDYFSMSIEDLMDVDITTLSKKEEKLFDTPAAVYVLTHDDIRRSGATNVPEALRMVPGLHVARLNSSTWAISARGFNSQFSNKLLVLIDGRSVYTPLFSGVFWDDKDLMLEDIERIEVIRGPGGSLWGANAVNGIINIITKSAADTQGVLISGGGGNEERGFGAVRYGGKINPDAVFRVYAKYHNRDNSINPDGEISDEWDMWRVGFRMDWQSTDEDAVTVQGDIYTGQINQTAYFPSVNMADAPIIETTDSMGGNVLTRWHRTLSESSDFTLQIYYDRTERTMSLQDFSVDIYDLDFQHHVVIDEVHDFLWGAGYRRSEDHIDGTNIFDVVPENEGLNLWSGFVQDKINLIENQWSVTIGSKFEHNDFTGFEYQPSVRTLWQPHQQHTFWGSISRAVRTPSRYGDALKVEMDFFMPGAGMTNFNLSGNKEMESEKMIAYELGYRVQPEQNLFFDITAFFNQYDDLQTFENTMTMNPSDDPPMTVLGWFDNKMDGETYGTELAANWKVTDQWRLSATYSFLQIQLHADNSSNQAVNEFGEIDAPHNQFSVRSYLKLPYNLEFDTMAYYVDNISGLDIPAYLRLDARLGWHITDQVELSIVGQNLIDNRHPEFGDSMIQSHGSEIQRSIYGRLTIRY